MIVCVSGFGLWVSAHALFCNFGVWVTELVNAFDWTTSSAKANLYRSKPKATPNLRFSFGKCMAFTCLLVVQSQVFNCLGAVASDAPSEAPSGI